MTLVAAWIQRNATLHQLVVASDSRISGGESWDACPKIVPLPRPATVIAMSGDAVEAYSFLIQAINTCNLLDGHMSGRTDIKYLANKLRAVYGTIRDGVGNLPRRAQAADIPDLDVVLMGWSWRRLRFEGYSYRFDDRGSLQMHQLRELDESQIYGAYMFGDAAKEARGRLKRLLKDREVLMPGQGGARVEDVAEIAFLRWEPLEVLLSMIADLDQRSVGGVPQVISIYQYGEAESFVWRGPDGVDYFGGRPVQQHERFDRRVLKLVDGVVTVSHSDRSMTLDGRWSATVQPAAQRYK